MTNRELETRYTQLKLTWNNLVNANIDLVDENKILKEDIEKLKHELREEKEAYIKMYNMYVEKENIINEFDKFIDLAIEIYNNVDVKTLNLVKDKLQELKGVDKSE